MAITVAGTPPAPLRNRKKVDALSADELTALRQAFSAMYGIDDDRGFGRYAGTHGLPLPISCQHHNPLFLPWHRAYLYLFEQALQDQVAGVTLPWWDYYAGDEPAIPAAYAQERANGAANPLAHGPITGIPHRCPPRPTGRRGSSRRSPTSLTSSRPWTRRRTATSRTSSRASTTTSTSGWAGR